MPPHGLRLPTIPTHDVASHNSEKSCYVTVGANVYNVTSFLPDHPGGGDLILEYGGKDVSEIMGDELSHVHSDAAYEILNDNLIGFVANETKVKAVVEHDRPEDIVPMLPNKAGMVALKADGITGIPDMKPVFAPTGLSSIEDPTKEIDGNANMKTHKFLDLNRPLLPQVWNRGFSKDFYLEQVHRPRYYSGGDSAPMFGNLLEPLTLTAWWIVPVVWLPPVLYMTFLAYRGIGSAVRTAEYFIVGLGFWTLVEYGVHRVSHADKYVPDNRVGITMHFILHGHHHYLPMDKYRCATSPIMTMILGAPIYKLVHSMFFWNWFAATALFCGVSLGYIFYEITHYLFHHKILPSYYQPLKRYHLHHHYADYETGFGVTTQFWDRVFGTELPPPKAAKAG